MPGTYTAKLTRGRDVFTTQIVVTLDPRAKYTAADRKQEFDAAMRVYNLLGDMSFEVDRINGVRDELIDRAEKLKGDATANKSLLAMADKLDQMRKKIVATKEGGGLTGEERIREKTTQLYGDIINYEGRPTDYQVGRIDSLGKELGDVTVEFNTFAAKDLVEANKTLAKKKLSPVQPITRKTWDEANESDSTAAAALFQATSFSGKKVFSLH